MKENDQLVEHSNVRAAASTIKKVGGLQLSVRFCILYCYFITIYNKHILRKLQIAPIH